MYTDRNLTIRPVTEQDLHALWTLTYKEEAPEWKRWDAPYYEHKTLSFDEYLKEKEKRIGQDDFWIIEVEGKVIGSVSYYWEHKPSQWLEMGIAIYDSGYWSGGYGTRALRLWITHLFNTLPLVRVGFTTWSGNQRMMKVGEKLGMTLEGRLRKCRYYNGKYYDSIRIGLLREEWSRHVL
ncbi:GNAT family N-acetyltransferase [Paenibacillus polymyxa]|uniref:GNAT family N-acetyltransferase n=1 Tax=Paenibacillus TaxID=44249 RepID=UPI000F4E9C83|nr:MULTISPECIES: GNAT family protein [Paenibacillus]KAF6654647.1 GNAT family N-acetyltransferase [Paenibacillus sp. EKM301P]RPD99444.1 N-acetyltransferase [Paenibacillus polymyxa]UBS86624.1 GNAT family N-acetyltransferase [Paenibacillus polymyxa]UQQ34681.1 GNAT family N-acetyltransferase [Paenibacillus polymyxa]WHX35152.1 GNAT family protein [Paenibacillus polymyxa]